ncbi:PTS lactose/cellobiose transporter subunit IIA [Enterococcus asini]|uniref:PTS lactose/cellobiose transporter subunit IIA n=1 Tax=Enterococcus TaxID=1350 RepID=UPI00289183D1|nr:PTS lactose/cellobiose transporter subunit IIA [Enterococcus asini]MDT2757616.1 PTS lactose/cellobiose transporter subunit IIA [Enterococcus asini]
MEEVIMQIILHAGNARSKSLLALRENRLGNLDQAETLLESAKEEVNQAHKSQTHLIQEEVRGNKQEVSLLLVHAQDHLMTAMAIRDVAGEVILNTRALEARLQKLEGGTRV